MGKTWWGRMEVSLLNSTLGKVYCDDCLHRRGRRTFVADLVEGVLILRHRHHGEVHTTTLTLAELLGGSDSPRFTEAITAALATIGT